MLPNYEDDPIKFYNVLKSLSPEELTQVWQPITEEKFNWMLDVLPPIRYKNGCYMVGEPMTHTEHGVIYQACLKVKDSFYSRPAYLHTFDPENYRKELIQ